jgi:hypothetical protein
VVNSEEALIAIGKISWEQYGKHTEETHNRASAPADETAS